MAQLDDDVKEKRQLRARHGRGAEERIHEILRTAVRSEAAAHQPLGSRIAARFRRVGLDEEIPELRDQSARPAAFEP